MVDGEYQIRIFSPINNNLNKNDDRCQYAQALPQNEHPITF